MSISTSLPVGYSVTAMNESWDWYESHDSATKECTLPYINNDNSREIVVYFEGHEYAGKHHDIARFKAAGFEEAIPLDNAFLYR